MSAISATGMGLPPANASSGGGASSVAQGDLNAPHPQYPAMLTSHVLVFEAIGTPAAEIARMNAQSPDPEYLDRYIQGEILQNPEGWDAYVRSMQAPGEQNPIGTARAGLQQLMPNVQLPPVNGGNPGYMPDGSPVAGPDVPGLSSPLLNPATGAPQGGGGLMKGALIAAAAVGVGILGWKLLHGRTPPVPAVADATEGFAQVARRGGLAHIPAATGKEFLATLGATGGGVKMAEEAATIFGSMHGLAPGNGHVQSVSAAAQFAGIDFSVAHKAAMDARWMDIMDKAAANGSTLGDMTAAGVMSMQALGGGAGAASTANFQGLRQLLAGMAAQLPA